MKNFFQERKRIIAIFAPTALGLIYLFLCFANLRQSIWFDESFSAYLTRFNFGEIWNLTAADVHPPLYYFLLKGWTELFGFTDVAMRSMSAVFGAIAILFAFLWIKYKYGLTAAIAGSFMLSICPAFVRYGQEMRMYTLMVAIVFAATYVLQLAIDTKKKKWWIIYAILVSAGMWTHYFCAFAWLAHVVYLFIIYEKKIFQKQIIQSYALAVILFLPWVPGLIAQVINVEGNGFWIGPVSLMGISNYWTQAILYMQASDVNNWLFVIAALSTAITFFLAIKYREKMKALLCMALVPLVLLIILSLPPLSSMFIQRYVLYAVCAITMISGVGLVLYWRDDSTLKTVKKNRKKSGSKFSPAQKKNAFCIACAAILLTISVIGTGHTYAIGNYNFDTFEKSASRDIMDDIAGLDGGRGYAVISQDPWLYYNISFYTNDINPVYFIDEGTNYEYGSMMPLEISNFDGFGKIEDLDAFLEDRDHFWYVGATPTETSTLVFPRENWRAVTISNSTYNEYQNSSYQIVLFERDDHVYKDKH